MLDAVHRAWRVLATGFSFAVLSVGGGLLAITVFPVIRLVTPTGPARVRRSQFVIHWVFRAYVRMLLLFGLIRLEVREPDRAQAPGGRMVVANHPSLLDVVLLMALIPRTGCIVKSALWESFWLGGVVRAAGYVRNDLDPEEFLAACYRIMKDGNQLIVFPEGTRTTPGEKPVFKRGFANVATLTGCEILPVTITCDPATLVKGEPWWKVPPRPPTFVVTFGETMDSRRFADYERPLAARKLVRALDDYYTERLGHGQSRA